LELAPDDALAHLNYTITLFSNDEMERARKQYAKFDLLYAKQLAEGMELDPDMKTQSQLICKALL
jgi:Bardet-Biedl syndrome 4 protein